MSMDEDTGASSVPQPQSQLDELVGVPTQSDNTPAYRVIGDSKIPVGKGVGSMWRGRWESGQRAQKALSDGWDEAVRYYNNDQSAHRVARSNASGNTFYSRRTNTEWSETENVIYSNINTITGLTYAKNPDVEITVDGEKWKAMARCAEKLLDKLANMNDAPGLALKNKAKQAILHAHLTNIAWMQINYTRKEASHEKSLQDLMQISEAYANEKDPVKVRELEGKLMALESVTQYLDPEGPQVKFFPAQSVICDPDSNEPLYTDKLWMMYKLLLPTDFLNARYGEKMEDGSVRSIYEPDIVLLGNQDGVEQQVNNFSIFQTSHTPAQYGYKTIEEMRQGCRTEVWMVWDKVTRRVLMFHAKNWTWPIWVWDDPYKLPGFFNMRPLVFSLAPIGPLGLSQTAYILDQQDAINEINDEERRARQQVKRNILFNKKAIGKDDVEKVLKGDDGTARGVDVPDGQTLKDCFLDPPMPILKAPQLFNKAPKLEAIDRILGTSEVLRSGQFKTNTTNGAIETYNSVTGSKLDEKIDIIEDWFGAIFSDVLHMCLMFMPKDMVQSLIGEEHANAWENMAPSEIRMMSLRCVGGSTVKPTSAAKKQEMISFGQMLGQFAKAAPVAVIKILLRMAQNSFSELDISDAEWKELDAEAQRNATGGAGDAGAPSGGGASMEQVAAMIDQLPPQAKIALGNALARGVPIAEAIPQIMELLASTQQAPQPQTMQ